MKNIKFSTLCIFALLTSIATSASATIVTLSSEVTRTVYTQGPEQRVVTPVTQCNIVDVPIYGQAQNNTSAGESAFLGMLLGGLGGKALGGSDTAAIGAVIGGIVGADKAQKKNNNSRVIVGYQQQRNCSTINQISYTPGATQCKTTVKIPALGNIQHTFTSRNCHSIGTVIDVKMNVTPI